MGGPDPGPRDHGASEVGNLRPQHPPTTKDPDVPPNQPGSPYRHYSQDRERRPEGLTLPLGLSAILRAVGRTYLRR